MTKTPYLTAGAFLLAHVLIVAPFVPVGSIPAAALGCLAVSAMALSLVLAARWRIVDVAMGGPDKSYSAHRWLGFFALLGTLGHWTIADSLGGAASPFFGDAGEAAGSVAANGLLIMSAAAMVRAIPYHLWKVSHMLMGPVFVLAVFHTFFVGSPFATGSLPWILMAVMSGAGMLGWAQTLIRKLVPTRLVTVESATAFDGGIDVTFRSEKPLPAFRAGQFATISYNQARAEAHPFTIAGGDETSRRFVIRAAGDWTQDFVASVKQGDQVRLGRGVGRFLPQVGAKRTAQLWVAGGVGITPFLAALEKMQPDDGAKITLLYCCRTRASAGGIKDVEAHARRLPQVELIVMSDRSKDGLTSDRFADIATALPDATQVYLCGPEGLKALVCENWAKLGKTGRIHSERFDFRGAVGLTELVYIGKSVLEMAGTAGKTYAPSRS